MRRDYRLYLDDILDAIKRVRDYVRGMDYTRFSSDTKTQDAVVRNLEIIGEASRQLPAKVREKVTTIEWIKMMSLRNILVHEYFGVNLLIIWDIVEHKLDPLAEACLELMEKETEGEGR
jgi:uncharacterized protein with HEPN domain